jgi:hypothetical protein
MAEKPQHSRQLRRNIFSDIPGIITHVHPEPEEPAESRMAAVPPPDFTGIDGLVTHIPRRGDPTRKEYKHLRDEE